MDSGMPWGPASLPPSPSQVFEQAATAFCALVQQVPAHRWGDHGLGDWDLRALVGHAGRALTTVVEYLGQAGDEPAQLTDAAAYFATATRLMPAAQLNESVRLRGVQAGAQLGKDPAATVRGWLTDAVNALHATSGDPVVPTVVGRMPLSAYLPTRTFELTVHGLDLAATLGVDAAWPEAALIETIRLAGDVAVHTGNATTVLRALTGRRSLPEGFSVLP
jgi:uncharacterized protein (TIGR03083 family)